MRNIRQLNLKLNAPDIRRNDSSNPGGDALVFLELPRPLGNYNLLRRPKSRTTLYDQLTGVSNKPQECK